MAESAWPRAKVDEGKLLDALAETAREAGEAILTIVRRGFEVESKHDTSPVTEADRAAELIILAALAQAAQIRVNFLTDTIRRRVNAMAALRGAEPAMTYQPHGR